MSYTRENLKYADDVLSSRRQRAQSIHDKRHNEVCKKVPEIQGYEFQLAQTGLAVAKALGMGEDAEKYINGLAETNAQIQKLIKDELVKAGYPEDYLQIPYTCKACEDTGFVGGYACTCRKELLTQLTIKDLEDVSNARECRFENFSLDYYSDEPDPVYGISPREKMEEILEYCQCYAEDFDCESGSLYMRGATGLGKTHLSLAIANVATRKGYNVVYGPAQALLSEIEKDEFSNKSTGAPEKKMTECDLLIIDDLGSEFSTRFTVSVIYDIINTRINLHKPVIISTNLTDQELESKYTQAIASRIIGNYTSLYFMGRDIRQIKAIAD